MQKRTPKGILNKKDPSKRGLRAADRDRTGNH